MPENMIDEARRRNVDLDKVDRGTLEKIDTFGWSVVMVGPVRTERIAPFAYTIGLSRLGSPELIIVGIDIPVAGRILTKVATLVRNGTRIDQGLLPGILLGDYVLDMREMSALHHDAYLGRLPWFHEHFGTGPLRVLQAVWPDDLGRYPDDPGVTRMSASAMPRINPYWTAHKTEPEHRRPRDFLGRRLAL